MDTCKKREDLNIVVAGHVDHGKSTVIGRLLADTGSLPEGKLEQVRGNCRRNSKPFEYAFLLDALKDEQSQGITIDSARCFFATKRRDYIIIDAPGHIEFLKNMVTGAARAEAAILVIAANEGVMENSTRHGYLLAMLGIKQVSVVVNKMDLVDYDRKTFNRIKREYSKFLKKIDIEASSFIPVSGMEGGNVANRDDGKMPWYEGPTVLEQMEDFIYEKEPEDLPFRMPVQGVYKFTNNNDDRRIVAGTVDTGVLSVEDQVTFYPSGKTSRVKSIEGFNEKEKNSASPGNATGFTLEDQIYVTRGEIVAVRGQKAPLVSRKIRANIFWLGKTDLTSDKAYHIKIGTAKVKCRLEKVERVLDASKLSTTQKENVERHEVAQCIFATEKPIAFDKAEEIQATGRFVIIDGYEIAGGGIITDSISDDFSKLQEQVITRNTKWIKSSISREKRASRYKQQPALIVISGSRDSGKKPIARELEKILFQNGELVYFMGMGSVVYGVDADIKTRDDNNREEHIRRVGEIINLMLDTGMILILTAIDLTEKDMDIIKTVAASPSIISIWSGEEEMTDFDYDMKFVGSDYTEYACEILKEMKNRGIIFGGVCE